MMNFLESAHQFYLNLCKKMQTIYAVEFAQLAEESKRRARNNEDARFDHPIMWVLMCAAMVASGIGTIYFITPSPSITLTINAHPEKYLKFADGNVFFSSAQSPKEIPSTIKKNPITLPMRNITKFDGYDPKSIWYEFQVSVPENFFAENKTGIMIPKVWGDSVVYVNNQKRDFGLNAWPILALTENKNTILIRVDTSTTSFSTPILATYPFVVSGLDDLRSLEKVVDGQNETLVRAMAFYLSVIFLFSILFLVYRKNPEVACFVFYFCAAFAATYFLYLNAANTKLFNNQNTQRNILKLFGIAKSFALFSFFLFYIRQPQKLIFRNFRIVVLGLILLICPMIIATNSFPQNANFQYWIGLLAQFYFLIAIVVLAKRDVLNILFSFKIPRERKISTMIILGFFCIFWSVNIFDYIFLDSKITTEYRNDLVMNLALSAAVAYEFARAKKNEKKYKEIASGEIAERISQDSSEFIHKGFIVLVDGIGFTQITKNITHIQARLEFMRKVCTHILQSFASVEGISTLNNTGDGFYFALRGSFSEESLYKVINACKNLLSNPLIISKNESLHFRAAIAYDFYAIDIVRYGNLAKDVAGGAVLDDLNRVIGNDPYPTLRLLVGEEMSAFYKAEASVLFDKHGQEKKYFTISQNKKAA